MIVNMFQLTRSWYGLSNTANTTTTVDENNGLVLNEVDIPEEIVTLILSYVDIQHILKCSSVCKKWNGIIKSFYFWKLKCNGIKKCSKKELPWYVYYSLFNGDFFDVNLLTNGNGSNSFNGWCMGERGRTYNKWIIESVPQGSDPLPDSPDFEGHECCFASSYAFCDKFQMIPFHKALYREILNKFKPSIYVSEWYAGRSDCGCIYSLNAQLLCKNKIIKEKTEHRQVEQWAGKSWEKVHILFSDYDEGITDIRFHHSGKDTQYWAGHYGSKMAGGTVKVLYDSLFK